MSNQEPQFAAGPPGWPQQAVIVAVLIGVGVASRFVWIDWPNFKPLLAIAIFCGFLASSRWMVLTAVAAMMLLSDALLGFYQWQLMVGVYGSMLLACSAGSLLPRLLHRHGSIMGKLGGIIGTTLVASTLFYLLTNTAAWFAGWHAAGWGGWVESLAAGIPFVKFTLAGDLFFSVLLFSGWFAISTWAAGRRVTRSGNGWAGTMQDSADRRANANAVTSVEG